MPVFTEYTTGTPCWTDVMTPDVDRTVSFYSDLFGWEAERDPRPEAGGYVMFTKDGKNVAAASPPMPGAEGAPPHWSTYIASDDVEATAKRVSEAGGTVLMEPMDVFERAAWCSRRTRSAPSSGSGRRRSTSAPSSRPSPAR